MLSDSTRVNSTIRKTCTRTVQKNDPAYHPLVGWNIKFRVRQAGSRSSSPVPRAPSHIFPLNRASTQYASTGIRGSYQKVRDPRPGEILPLDSCLGGMCKTQCNSRVLFSISRLNDTKYSKTKWNWTTYSPTRNPGHRILHIYVFLFIRKRALDERKQPTNTFFHTPLGPSNSLGFEMRMHKSNIELFLEQSAQFEKSEDKLLFLSKRHVPCSREFYWIQWDSFIPYLTSSLGKGTVLHSYYVWSIVSSAPSSSSIVFRALFPTIVILILTGFMVALARELNVISQPVSMDSGAEFAVATTYAGVYIGMTKRFSDQWEYCANLFNTIFIQASRSHDDRFDTIQHAYRKTVFAIDVLDCGMWHHRSFRAQFNLAVENAILSDETSREKHIDNYRSFCLGHHKRRETRKLLSDLATRFHDCALSTIEA